jgi:hypothetical protein
VNVRLGRTRVASLEIGFCGTTGLKRLGFSNAIGWHACMHVATGRQPQPNLLSPHYLPAYVNENEDPVASIKITSHCVISSRT